MFITSHRQVCEHPGVASLPVRTPSNLISPCRHGSFPPLGKARIGIILRPPARVFPALSIHAVSSTLGAARSAQVFSCATRGHRRGLLRGTARSTRQPGVAHSCSPTRTPSFSRGTLPAFLLVDRFARNARLPARPRVTAAGFPTEAGAVSGGAGPCHPHSRMLLIGSSTAPGAVSRCVHSLSGGCGQRGRGLSSPLHQLPRAPHAEEVRSRCRWSTASIARLVRAFPDPGSAWRS